jgi:hypothetical protein
MTHEDDRVTRLKQRLVVGEYRVNADDVAREMLSKLQLVGLSRTALLRIRRDAATAGARASVHG